MKAELKARFICNASEPIVDTKQGKIRGFCFDGIFSFHGIQYARASRFCPPEPVEAWDGVKDALAYGYVAPLLKQPQPQDEVSVPHRYWPENECCQFLNVWTNSLDSMARKPVMVWIHGGGYESGSSIEMLAYDGAALCDFGDVVVVSLNHRLNILGYFDLSAYSRRYANTANLGNDDIIAALRWIHDNIGAFGGDATNITLFGQSGGGAKIINLLQMPAADGLFHKAIIQSGLVMGFNTYVSNDGDAHYLIEAMLTKLNVGKDNIEELENLPLTRLYEAYLQVAPALRQAGRYVGNIPRANDFYRGDPLAVGFRDENKHIPLIVGSCIAEFPLWQTVTDKWNVDTEAVKVLIKQKYGEHAEAMVSLFGEAYPERNLADLLVLDFLFRLPSQQFIAKRSAESSSSIYSYLFSLDFPLEKGKAAWHCAEIPYVFHNTALVPVSVIPGVSDRLANQMAGAFSTFARTGVPSHPELPLWQACAAGDEAVMIFDRECRVRHNFDHELTALNAQSTDMDALLALVKELTGQ